MVSKNKAKKEKFYINDEDLSNEIKKYYITNNFSHKLGQMILMIATNLRYKPNFINYTWGDDMISDATHNMCKAILQKKFNFNACKCPSCNNKFQLTPSENSLFAERINIRCPSCNKIVNPVFYKPFDYLTTIANYAFINRIKIEKKNKERKTEYTQRLYDEILIDNPEYNIYIKHTGIIPNADDITYE